MISNTLQYILSRKYVFPCVSNFTLIYGAYSCLIDGLFGHILIKYFFCFWNAWTIFMFCNSNLTKLEILTLLSSDCRAWALKLSKYLKKRTHHVFVFILLQCNLTHLTTKMMFSGQCFCNSCYVYKRHFLRKFSEIGQRYWFYL